MTVGAKRVQQISATLHGKTHKEKEGDRNVKWKYSWERMLEMLSTLG